MSMYKYKLVIMNALSTGYTNSLKIQLKNILIENANITQTKPNNFRMHYNGCKFDAYDTDTPELSDPLVWRQSFPHLVELDESLHERMDQYIASKEEFDESLAMVSNALDRLFNDRLFNENMPAIDNLGRDVKKFFDFIDEGIKKLDWSKEDRAYVEPELKTIKLYFMREQIIG